MSVAAPFNDLQPVRRMDEAEAERISQRIDEELKAERDAIKRRKGQKRDVKVMLLGQAESGKSTLQKQFQLYYASQTLEKERPAWRPIVHFNIIKAVRMILEELDYQLTSTSPIDESPTGSPATTPAPSVAPGYDMLKRPPLPQPPLQHMSSIARGKLPAVPPLTVPSNEALGAGSGAHHNFLNGNGTSHHAGASGNGGASGSTNVTKAGLGSGIGWQDDLAVLRTKLLPLVAVEESMARDLSGGVAVSAPGAGGRAGVFVRAGWQVLAHAGRSRRVNGEASPVSPTSTAGTAEGPNGTVDSYSNTLAASHGNTSTQVNDLVARMLAATCEEIGTLWKHPNVRALVKLRKVRLEESAAFFVENIERISQPGYLPTTEDILKVRLQTLGVKEHSFDINLGGARVNWLLYDVGGARHAWVPYFDDATAIIFLAPISAFDQYLEEDPRTNRIDDSLQLFTVICRNKLLKNTHLVLLLNKTDLLRQKLDAGIKVRKYITSYGDRANRFEEVSEYFRAHFLQVHRRNDISKRALYAHFTSMLDIKATQKIIVNVGEAIIRSYITDAGLT